MIHQVHHLHDMDNETSYKGYGPICLRTDMYLPTEVSVGFLGKQVNVGNFNRSVDVYIHISHVQGPQLPLCLWSCVNAVF